MPCPGVEQGEPAAGREVQPLLGGDAALPGAVVRQSAGGLPSPRTSSRVSQGQSIVFEDTFLNDFPNSLIGIQFSEFTNLVTVTF